MEQVIAKNVRQKNYGVEMGKKMEMNLVIEKIEHENIDVILLVNKKLRNQFLIFQKI
ncbi:hypothetical protein IKO18_05655 [bacterium]|nr:hypothetical protein [bacterium]